MTGIVNINSYSHLIMLGWLARVKLIPPFSNCAKFARSNYPKRQDSLPPVAERAIRVGDSCALERASDTGGAYPVFRYLFS